MARNHYFTGKLLVERDFTDEQRYFMGKLRRHNQRLHGWGTVCGLKVLEHPNPSCQKQFVVIKPGTAIDCCGREILVTCEEYFDFKASFLAKWQQENAANLQPDSNKHTIQICLAYRECPIENVPAVFDDCGSSDANSCQPNRILEGHYFDVLIDPKIAPASQGVALDWFNTLNIANVVKVALNPSNNYLYVLTTTSLCFFDNKNTLNTGPSLPGTGLDLAIAPDGDYIYVATQGSGTPLPAPQINVFSVANLSQAVQPFNVGTANDSTLRLAVIPGQEGSLISCGQTAGLTLWSGVNAGTPTSSTVASITNPVAVTVSPDGQYAYVATAGNTAISVVTLASLTTPLISIPLNSSPSSLAIAAGATGSLLAALDTTAGASKLYFVNVPPGGPSYATPLPQTVANLANSPTQVLLSGQMAYVLETDSATPPNAYVQLVNLSALEAGQSNYLGTPIPIGAGQPSETLSQDGSQLFVPYYTTTTGGVAVFKVVTQNCADLFGRMLDGCPDCAKGNCLVLATVTGYTYNDSITDPTMQPPGPDQLDNLTGRRVLPSTDLLAEVAECLFNQGSSGTQPAASGLVAIQSISWPHGGTVTIELIQNIADTFKFGLQVAFTGNVQYSDISTQSVALLVPLTDSQSQATYWAELPVQVQAGNFATTGDISSQFTVETNGPVNGLSIVYVATQNGGYVPPAGFMWVRIRGDFIRDMTGRAIDADHLPPWLTNPPPPVQNVRTGDGIAGGTFESWFTLAEPST